MSLTDNINTTQFAYDASGQRLRTEVAPTSLSSGNTKTVTTYPFPGYEVEQRYTWQYQCPSEENCFWTWAQTATITRKTYFLGGQAIATHISGDPSSGNNGFFYLHGDHLGSTSLLTYGNGQTNPGTKVSGSETRYYPYGAQRGTAPTQSITDRNFTGQAENLELGLIYYNARFYSPTLGRFLTADTIVPDPARPQSANRYSYVENNPTGFIDPSGHNRDCGVYDSYCNGLTAREPLPASVVTIELSLQQGNRKSGLSITGTAIETNAILSHNHVFPADGHWTAEDVTNITIRDTNGTVLFSGTSTDFVFVTGSQLGEMGDALSLFVFRDDFTTSDNTESLAVIPSNATEVYQGARKNTPPGLYPTSVNRIYTELLYRGDEELTAPSIEVSPDRTVRGDSGMPLFYNGRVVGVNNSSPSGNNTGRYGRVTDIATIRWVIENKTRALQTSFTPGQQ